MVSTKTKVILQMCCRKIVLMILTIAVLGYFVKNYEEVSQRLLASRGSHAEYVLKETFFHTIIFIFPINIVPACFIASLLTLIRSSEVTESSIFDTMSFLFDAVGMITYLAVGGIVVNYWVKNETPFEIQSIGILSFIASVLFFLEWILLCSQKYRK